MKQPPLKRDKNKQLTFFYNFDTPGVISQTYWLKAQMCWGRKFGAISYTKHVKLKLHCGPQKH